MDNFVRIGSDQACAILKQIGASAYDRTCVGFGNADAYYQAGVVFWSVTGLAVVLSLFLIRKWISSAFG